MKQRDKDLQTCFYLFLQFLSVNHFTTVGQVTVTESQKVTPPLSHVLSQLLSRLLPLSPSLYQTLSHRSVICLKHNLQSEMMIIAGINFCLIFYILSSNLGSWRHDDDDDDDEVGF